MFRNQLQPSSTQIFSLGETEIEVPKCSIFFKKWAGKPVNETFGGKPVIDVGGKPVFAELAIMNSLVKSGWQARWVETYGKSSAEPIYLSEWKDDKFKNQKPEPIKDSFVNDALKSISEFNGNSFSGCWDVLGWKDKTIIFAESKRKKRDSIRPSQVSWLAAGLRFGLKKENFLVVEWDFEE